MCVIIKIAAIVLTYFWHRLMCSG